MMEISRALIPLPSKNGKFDHFHGYQILCLDQALFENNVTKGRAKITVTYFFNFWFINFCFKVGAGRWLFHKAYFPRDVIFRWNLKNYF